MQMSKPDKETQKVMSEGRAIRDLLEHEGWEIVKGRIDEYILDLQNINNLDFDNMEAMAIDARARRMAAETLFNWLKELYGDAEQFENNKDKKDEDKKGYIERL